MARYLVTGGAGYVGSHTVLALLDRGDEVVVLDDLSKGHRAAVPAAAKLVEGRCTDAAAVEAAIAAGPFEAVLHDEDVWEGTSRAMRMARAAECPCCGPAGRREFLHAAEARTTLCGSEAVQVWPRNARDSVIDLKALATRLATAGSVSSSAMMVRFKPAEGTLELSLFADGRAIVKGTRDEAAARAAYAKYVGA